jgi:hypothetical protein
MLGLLQREFANRIYIYIYMKRGSCVSHRVEIYSIDKEHLLILIYLTSKCMYMVFFWRSLRGSR